MTLRDEFRRGHPDFPLLDLNDGDGVTAYLKRIAILEVGETVEGVTKAGEGNMNLTLRVQTDRRSLLVKQARPWVEKYDHIPAPWDRILRCLASAASGSIR